MALAPEEIALVEAKRVQVEVDTAKARILLKRLQEEDRKTAAKSSVVRHL